MDVHAYLIINCAPKSRDSDLRLIPIPGIDGCPKQSIAPELHVRSSIFLSNGFCPVLHSQNGAFSYSMGNGQHENEFWS